MSNFTVDRKCNALLSIVMIGSIAAYVAATVFYDQFQLFHIDAGSNSRDSRDFLEESLMLRPGDLPGYTGWARPSKTLAGWFNPPVADVSPDQIFTRRYVTFRSHCPAAACKNGGSVFYVRAYGRALLPGKVTDHKNGTYDISIFPFDSGTYYLEVVLAFSLTPPFDMFPLPNGTVHPALEGYLLPGCPLQFEVRSGRLDYDTNRSCRSSDLVGEFITANERGRWVLQYKVNSRQGSPRNPPVGNLGGYQTGENSMGFGMEYAPSRCTILKSHEFREGFHRYGQGQIFHVVFIGDSNVNLQRLDFARQWNQILQTLSDPDTRFPNLNITYIMTHGGLQVKLPKITSELQSLLDERQANDSHVKYFIIFNSGLHDIGSLCGFPGPPCADVYRSLLEQLVQVVDSFPASLKVFQTTTAGWMRWGNYGFAWPLQKPQLIPRDPSFVQYFNCIADKVLVNSSSIVTLDAYWTTIARPEDRQVDADSSMAKKIVHCGVDIYDDLNRKFLTLMLESIRENG